VKRFANFVRDELKGTFSLAFRFVTGCAKQIPVAWLALLCSSTPDLRACNRINPMQVAWNAYREAIVPDQPDSESC
jgi:hypothetical protein